MNKVKSNISGPTKSKIINIIDRHYKGNSSSSSIQSKISKHTAFHIESFLQFKSKVAHVSIPVLGKYLYMKKGDKHFLITGYTKKSVYSKLVDIMTLIGGKAAPSIYLILNLLSTKWGFLSGLLPFIMWQYPGLTSTIFSTGKLVINVGKTVDGFLGYVGAGINNVNYYGVQGADKLVQNAGILVQNADKLVQSLGNLSDTAHPNFYFVSGTFTMNTILAILAKRGTSTGFVKVGK